MEIAQPAKQCGIVICRCGLHSVDPGEDLLIGNLEPALKLGKITLTQRGELRIGETAQHQVHFANTAMPAAIQQTTPTRIEALARQVRSGGHQMSPTPKTRTGPGADLYRGRPFICHGRLDQRCRGKATPLLARNAWTPGPKAGTKWKTLQ